MLKLSIYAGSLLLLLASTPYANVLLLVEREIHRLYGDKVKIHSAKIYPPKIDIKKGKVKLNIKEGYPEGSAIVKYNSKIARVRLKLLWKRKVPVALYDISRGETLSKEKIKWKFVYTDKNARYFISEKDFLEDYVALRHIKAGDLISKRFLRKRYLVKRGDTVRIIYRKGSILITYEAEALENGYRESVIRLKVLPSGKIIRGRVIEEGKVEIR